jgi:hypothetical protein
MESSSDGGRTVWEPCPKVCPCGKRCRLELGHEGYHEHGYAQCSNVWTWETPKIEKFLVFVCAEHARAGAQRKDFTSNDVRMYCTVADCWQRAMYTMWIEA